MSVNHSEAFQERVTLATRVISRRRETTRGFDSCFENHDGAAVAAAIYRRSRKNAALRANLYRYLNRKMVVMDAFRSRRKRNLSEWARELRNAYTLAARDQSN